MKVLFDHVVPPEVTRMPLRASDVLELAAFSGHTPEEALSHALEVSDWARVARDADTGELIAAFGVAPYPDSLPGVGSPWFLATDKVSALPQTFFRQSRRWLLRMHETYPVLCNYVDVRNKAALQWVDWLGFDILHPYVEGLNGEQFIQIVRTQCANP